MSAIVTTTSSGRPQSPTNGGVYFETDTNRIIVWDGGMWHVYNRDSLSLITSGTEDLHYPQGIYSNTSANYHIATSPILHFDSNHMDGLTTNNPYADNQWAQVWYDRTQNRHKFVETTSGSDAKMQFSGPMPYVRNFAAAYFPDYPSTTPTEITGELTLMYVMNPAETALMAPTNYSSGYRNGTGTSFNFLGKTLDPGVHSSSQTDYFLEISGSTGPGIFIGRNSATKGLQVWRPDSRNNVRPAYAELDKTFSYRSTTHNIPSLLHTYHMCAYEIIWWDKALTIAEINTVKDYFQNKYLGLNDDFFPAGGTNDLVES
jgi:hypothetical protein